MAATFAANGRVNSIAVDPTNHDIVYLGSAGGGVWKSVDRGAHWQPLTDQEVSLGIGTAHAIAIDPSHPNTIYVGTSSFALLDQSLPRPIDSAQSRGILKSTDGGASWTRLGSGTPTGNTGNAASTFFGVNVNTIIVDPADGNVLYVAAGRGNDPNFGGMFRSTDAGQNWTRGNGTANMWVESLVLDASSPPASRVLYAGAWGQGVLKSTDGGQNWAPALAPGALSAVAPLGISKTMVALAPPSNPPLPAGPAIYASVWKNVAFPARPLELIFSSTSGGTSWTQRSAQVVTTAFFTNGVPDPLFSQGFSDLAVDPDSPGDGVNDRVLWGGGTQFLSTDSGDTFNEIGQINGIHGDHQTWLVVPEAGTNAIYIGDDGGIWRSEDGGDSWTGTSFTSLSSTINGGGLQTATMYQLTVKQDATAGVTLAGAQDSGVLRTTGGQTWSGTSDDGIDLAFERVNPEVVYAIRNTSFLKSTDSGASFATEFTSKLQSSQISIFRNRYAVDPNNGGTLYVGGSGSFPSGGPVVAPDVLQTRDGTTSFRSLGLAAPSYISSLAVAPSDSNRLVVASQNQVFVTTNALAATVGPPAGVSFQDVTANLPARFVTRVAFDPNDADVIYATVSGFGTGHVFQKSLAATNWTDISPAVDVPVNAMALDDGANPAVLYVGTDLGVLRRSVAAGASWEVVDDLHLPNAAVSDLEINAQAGVLRAATWGRGAFELAAPTGPAVFVAETGLAFGRACAVTGKDLSLRVSNVGIQNLTVSSVQRIAGSSAFTVLSSPATPLAITPGSEATFTVHYTPTVPAAAESAIIRVSSNDPAVPFVDLLATGTLETTPPNITALGANPSVLLVANHKMVPVTVAVGVTDDCDSAVAQSCQIVSIVSNEPVSGTGEGDTAPDWQITGQLTANLRAERSGMGTGRTYTLLVRCTDSAGNSASRATAVTVPHN